MQMKHGENMETYWRKQVQEPIIIIQSDECNSSYMHSILYQQKGE